MLLRLGYDSKLTPGMSQLDSRFREVVEVGCGIKVGKVDGARKKGAVVKV